MEEQKTTNIVIVGRRFGGNYKGTVLVNGKFEDTFVGEDWNQLLIDNIAKAIKDDCDDFNLVLNYTESE